MIPHQLMDDEVDDIPSALQGRPRNTFLDPIGDEFGSQEQYENMVNLEDFDGPLREWLDEDRVRKEIKNRFKNFITGFTDTSGNAVYPEQIKLMCQDNGCSLCVSYMHLSDSAAVLAIWLVEQPSILLEMFDAVAMEVAQTIFPDYNSIHKHIHVRVTNLPLTDELRDLPQLQLVRFDCMKCGFTTAPIAQNTGTGTQSGGGKFDNLIRPTSCPDCNGNGPFRLNESKTVYRNYQKIVVQESPGSVLAGRIPRSREVILVDDLCDGVRPGEQVQIAGIYRNVLDVGINVANGFPVFSTVIEANNVLKERDFMAAFSLSDEEKEWFSNTISKRPDLERVLIDEVVAPSIYGHEYIKQALLYALVGGQEKIHENKHRSRGDINILILGDPGVGKSQFLKYAEKLAPRSVYSTGKGASAA